MITSIKVNGKHSIGVRDNKVEIDGNTLDINKEIPFVRYNLGEMAEPEIDYIKSMKEKFKASTHLVEINAEDNPNLIDTVKNVRESLNNVAVYVYFNITDDNVESKSLAYTMLEEIKALKNVAVDRIMFKDKTTTLDTVTSENLIKQASKESGIAISTFGICSSPLSFGDNACLTAIKARELMSKYSEIADVALPSANHQCMNCCGCIRYINVTSDIEAPPEKVKKAKTNKGTASSKDPSNKNTGVNKEKKPAKSKATVVIPGQFNL